MIMHQFLGIVGGCGWLWVVMGDCASFSWVIVGDCGWLWVIVGDFLGDCG